MKKYLPALSLIVFLVMMWEALARIVDTDFILPGPVAISLKLYELADILFLHHTPATLTVILISLCISLVLGVFIAILMNLFHPIEQAIYPILITSQTIPIIALAPIFVLWFGYSIWSKILVSVLFTFFPITISTFDGFKSTSKAYKELLLAMGGSRRDIFFKLEIKQALPSFFSGVKVAIPLSVVGAAIGEWLGAQSGLGYFSRRMMTQFDGAGVFAPIVILSAIGIILFLMVLFLEKTFLKWSR